MSASTPWLAGAAGLVAASAGLAYAALGAQSQLLGSTLIAGRNPLQAALTYDDGPNPAGAGGTEALLDVLAAHNARATFFMIGGFVRREPALARRVLAAGHLIGNHTETHPWLHAKSEAVIREELRACNEALEDALGAGVRYFRPPHGARRPAVMRIAHELGLTTVQWNVMAKDWLPIGTGGILANIGEGLAHCRRRRRGANILLHDGSNRALGTPRADTVAVTDILLRRFAATGIRPVTVDVWG